MNAIFLGLFCLATITILFTNAELFLPTVLGAATDAAALCVALLASYAVWMGLIGVWEKCGITKGISKLLRPVCKRLFKTNDEPTLQAISANLACNMLGIGGAATPYGVQAARILNECEYPEYSSCMFFALNATSIQLLPTSVVGIRASLGSGNAADIILPTLICTALSTAVACFLTWLFLRPAKKWANCRFFAKKCNKKVACTR
jgi:spore maturation protein A